jgi:hypothetical protein
MKDIDFDELDRAVSSLMNTTPNDTTDTDSAKLEESGGEEKSTVSMSKPTVSSESELSQTKEPEALPVLDTARPAAAVAPVTRRGRFMDVVRPSGRDMKRPSTLGPVSREGVTLEPASDTNQVEMPSADASDAHSSSTKAATEEVKPFDFSMGLEPTTESEVPVTEIAGESAPLSSPFLPDAKVEKRPLGRPADVVESVDSVTAPTENTEGTTPEIPVASKDAQLPEQPLPPELDSKLLSIETGAETFPSDTEATTVPVVEKQPIAVAEPVVPAAAPVSPIVTTSIPEQYKLQPQKDDEVPASAIYDTQPLAHPEKKTPGWLWIVGIVAILLLGIGGGAAVYYLGLL